MPNILPVIIFFVVINIISGTLKDKKKIEEERQKKIQEARKNQGNIETKTQPRKKKAFEGALFDILDELANEGKQDKEPPKKEPVIIEKELYKETRDIIQSMDPIDDSGTIDSLKAIEDLNPLDEEASGMRLSKEDLIQGIIFSEILDKPKSIRNR